MKKIRRLTILFLLAGISLLAEGQTFELSESGTLIAIKGTSTLHDWQMELTTFNSGFHLNRFGSEIEGFDNVSFRCKAKDIKSESSLMDKKAYNALRADDYPFITYTGMSVTGLKTEGMDFTGNLSGKLNVAGKTRDVIIPFNGSFTDNSTISINAETVLKMSSFNINPPTAMLGALKTSDEITVSLSLQFVQKNIAEGASY